MENRVHQHPRWVWSQYVVLEESKRLRRFPKFLVGRVIAKFKKHVPVEIKLLGAGGIKANSMAKPLKV
jgi:hypothetical protein